MTTDRDRGPGASGGPPARAAVIGCGAWGTCLAILLHEKGTGVRLWARRPAHAEAVARSRENATYLAGVPIPHALPVTGDLAEALAGAEVIVFAVPSAHLRGVARAVRAVRGHAPAGALLVSATKGIEEGSGSRMTEVLRDEIAPDPRASVAALAGPSHAEEVARRRPTAVVAAAESGEAAERVRDLFATESFRVYTNADVVGVELAVALKNIIAIAAGICDGLGFGDNTRGALLTRGLAEMTRLGVALGARPETFWGLAGLGDLVTTCTSRHSRNRWLGEEIGRGRPLDAILAEMRMVAEGVPTTRSALALAAACRVEIPIAAEVAAILFDGKNPHDSMESLMNRLPKSEIGTR